MRAAPSAKNSLASPDAKQIYRDQQIAPLLRLSACDSIRASVQWTLLVASSSILHPIELGHDANFTSVELGAPDTEH